MESACLQNEDNDRDFVPQEIFFVYFYDIIILLELIQVIILTRLGMNKKGSRGNVTIMKFIESK